MKQNWRWFGPIDQVSIREIRQAGAEGVVSALHHVPAGDIWTSADIELRKIEIEREVDGAASGLIWEVVESLPVSEDIKKQRGEWRSHIANYKTSLINLAEAGLNVVCYNFMPLLDWTRTDLAFQLPSGATCMRFDIADFVAFDVHVLKRDLAIHDYSSNLLEIAEMRFAAMNTEAQKKLCRNVICGLPGASHEFSLEEVRHHLAEYATITEGQLRDNLIGFLEQVAPLAESLGLRLCCHPDDPPFPLLGLPRIMSTEEHYRKVMSAVDLPSNGITLCSGSLGARHDNDLPGFMKRLGDRVHFLHLRNVIREGAEIQGSFYEAEHLHGDTDMVALVQAVLDEEENRLKVGREDFSIPFRPDHGHDIIGDLQNNFQPGYPTIGRLKGLAELRGVLVALSHKDRNSQ